MIHWLAVLLCGWDAANTDAVTDDRMRNMATIIANDYERTGNHYACFAGVLNALRWAYGMGKNAR